MFVCLDQSGCTIGIGPSLVGIGVNCDAPMHWHLVGEDGVACLFFMRSTAFEFYGGAVLVMERERGHVCLSASE